MKIIVASPRTGSTFYSRYLEQINTGHTCIDEYFMPLLYSKEQNEFDETTKRLQQNHETHIIKIITGKEVDIRVWNWLIKDKVPVTILKRKNIKRQILSFGISCLNDVWVTFHQHAYLLSQNKKIPINEVCYQSGEYKREWFDSIVYRIKMLEHLETELNVEDVCYYEDITKLQHTITNRIPTKQNNHTDDELCKFFTNYNQLNDWINS